MKQNCLYNKDCSEHFYVEFYNCYMQTVNNHLNVSLVCDFLYGPTIKSFLQKGISKYLNYFWA